MGFRYGDTLEFDLAVLLIVVLVMPAAVFLMQSKRKLARVAAFALMLLAVAYVGGFEHYRIRNPDVTEGGLKRALLPASVVELLDVGDVRYLPIAADEATVRAAILELTREPTTEGARANAGVREAPGKRARRNGPRAERAVETASLDVSPARDPAPTKERAAAAPPLAVHLSHEGAGDGFFRDAFKALEARTCGENRAERQDAGDDEGNERDENERDENERDENERDENDAPAASASAAASADASAPADPPASASASPVSEGAVPRDASLAASPSAAARLSSSGGLPPRSETKTGRCVLWCAGTKDEYREEVDSFTFERATPDRMKLLGRPYRAVFVVRDPRDVVAEAYLDHLSTTEAWARLRRDDLDGASFQEKLRAMSAEEGVDLEMDRFDAEMSGWWGRLGPNLERRINRLVGSARDKKDAKTVGAQTYVPLGDIEPGAAPSDDVSARGASGFARALRAFARSRDEGVRFVRYEDIRTATPAGFELVGAWFGMRGAALETFAAACAEARDKAVAEERRAPRKTDDAAGTAEIQKPSPDARASRGAEAAGEPARDDCGGGATGARCSATRRKASLAPGAWRDVFTPGNAARFEKAHAPLLRGLGYPPAGDRAPRGAAVETE